MKLKIVNLEGLYLEDEVDAIVVKTTNGELTILNKHLPLIANCTIDILKVIKNQSETLYALAGGVLFVDENETKIITMAIESQKEINFERALKAKERAEIRLKDSQSDIKRAEIALKKAINRLSLK